MHRLLSQTCGKVVNCFPISHFYLKQNSNQACFFCKQRHAQLVAPVQTINRRSLSTIANSDVLVLKGKKTKKTRKSKEKYTELFEVGDNESNLKKILIQNVNATHIDHLTQNLETISEEDDFLKEDIYLTERLGKSGIFDSDNYETDLKFGGFLDSGPEAYKDDVFSDSYPERVFCSRVSNDSDPTEKSEFTDDASIPDQESTAKKQSKKKKPSKKNPNDPESPKLSKELIDSNSLKTKLENLRREEKEKNFNETLLSFVEVSVHCQYLNRALQAVTMCHLAHKSAAKANTNTNKVKLTNPKIFSTLAHGFAMKKNLSKVKEIMHIFLETDIQPTAQLFAACFECMGRLPRSSELDSELNHLSKWLEKEALSLDQLFTETEFIHDQKERVLEAVRRLKPDFEIKDLNPSQQDSKYTCPLLLHFNNIENNFRSPAEHLLTPKSLKKLALEQLKAESNMVVNVESVEKVDVTPEVLKYRKQVELMKEIWMKNIKRGLLREISMLDMKTRKFGASQHVNLYPYLRVLDLQTYAEVVMQEVEKLMEDSELFSNSLNYLFREIGNQVRLRYLIKSKKQSDVLNKQFSLYKAYCDWYINPDSSSSNTREKWQQLVHDAADSGPDVMISDLQWNNSVCIGIGRLLYSVITKDVKIDISVLKKSKKSAPQIEPAFFILFRTHGVRANQEIKPHPVLTRLIKLAQLKNLRFETTLVPMLSPPLPWSSSQNGGYIVSKATLIRESSRSSRKVEESPVQEMYPSLDSLNQLGSIPWIINKPILEVIVKVFNSGGSHKLNIPMPSSACPTPSPIPPDATKQQRFQAVRERFNLARKRSEMHSLRCDALYRLSLANHYRDRIFWLPHNMDFRGRVYPVAPLLNHLGADMARSMLLFAKGEPLGQNGLDWLKIHLINLTGLKKKEAIQTRLDYANEILPDILDSADKPLDGKQWWADSEKPWQTLACCVAIRDAINSGDPESFVCHFPVHQDGSCNGLQHYAALGRDLAGGISVNLTPSDVPQDVYSCVAELVEEERKKDAANGVEIAIKLDGFIRRKVIKQTVMTTVYGVTRFGARLQIAKQLKDIDEFPKEEIWRASSYLVGKTFFSLQEMFTSTKQIQDWFTQCARLISQSGNLIEWVTPLGLPIIQPYIRPGKINKKLISDLPPQMHSTLKRYLERPHTMQQKNAFPPNFIHSLDSSHMMLTSLHCEQQNITFVSVHDCYWTHPNSVEIMNEVCRDQFVSLHSLPILEDLSAYLFNRFGFEEEEFSSKSNKMKARQILNQTLKQVPQKGELDIQQVKDSVYFFS